MPCQNRQNHYDSAKRVTFHENEITENMTLFDVGVFYPYELFIVTGPMLDNWCDKRIQR